MKHSSSLLRSLAVLCLCAVAPGCLDNPSPREEQAFEPIPIPAPGHLDLPEPRVDGLFAMSWNLENFPRSAQTSDAVIRVLQKYRPDVVALQEIGDLEAFEALDEALAGYEGILNDDDGAIQRIAVLVNTERVTVNAVETLFQGDWYAFPRPPLRVDLTWRNERGAQFDFSVVGLHLKAMVDQDSQYRRRLACEKLDTWLQGEMQRAGADQDFILMGDWNDELTDPAESNVFAPLLSQADKYRFLTAEVVGTGMYSYIPYRKLIDHVMVTTDALSEYGKGSTIVLPLDEEEPYYRNLVSDHRPVMSRFQVPGTGLRR